MFTQLYQLSRAAHAAARFSRPNPTVLLPAAALAAVLTFSAAARADTPGGEKTDEPVPLSNTIVTGTSDSYTVPAVGVGSKIPVSLRETPNSVSVITQERIQDQNLVTLADALNQITGVTVIANDTTQSQYRSRGYSLGELNDGIPAYNALSGYQQFDLALYDHIEVLRGPAGIFQGTGDPAGVVNFVRKRATDSFNLSAATSVGTWNNYRAEFDVNVPVTSAVATRFVASGQDRDFFYDRSHDRKGLAYGTIDWRLTKSTTVSVWGTVQTDTDKVPYMGLPAWTTGYLLGVSRSTNPYADWDVYRWLTKDYGLDLEQKFGENWSVRFRPTRRDQSYYFKDSYPTTGVDPVANTVTYARRVRDYNYVREAVDVYLAGSFPALNQTQHLTLGYNYDSLWTDYSGVTAPSLTGILFGHPELVPSFDLPYNLGGQSKTTQSGFYGQLRAQLLDPLVFVGGARISKYDTKSRNVPPASETAFSWGARARHEATPYAGLVYDFTRNLSLYGSYSDIFVPQSQLKFSGEPLDPRRGKQYEAGIKAEFFNKRLNASIARFDLKDTGRSFADLNHTNFYLNAGEVQSKGWEAEVTGTPYPGIEIQLGYTRLDTIYANDASNRGLTFDTWEPRHTVRSWAKYHFETGPLHGFFVGLGANYASRSLSGNGTSALRGQGGYTVTNALFGYAINTNLSVALNINNVFDKIYYTRLGGLNTYNTYGDPRNFALTVRYSFK